MALTVLGRVDKDVSLMLLSLLIVNYFVIVRLTVILVHCLDSNRFELISSSADRVWGSDPRSHKPLRYDFCIAHCGAEDPHPTSPLVCACLKRT